MNDDDYTPEYEFDDDGSRQFETERKKFSKRLRYQLHKYQGSLPEIAKLYGRTVAELEYYISRKPELEAILLAYQRSVEITAADYMQKIVMDPNHPEHFKALMYFQKKIDYEKRYAFPKKNAITRMQRKDYKELLQYEDEIKKRAEKDANKHLGLPYKQDSTLEIFRKDINVPEN